MGPSKSSPARSARTMGATGRDCSRPFMSLSRSRLAALVALASRLRCPRARGPYSLRPWNQATTPSAAMTSATASARSGGPSGGSRALGPVVVAPLEPGAHPVGGDDLGHRLGQVGRALVGDPGRGQPGGQLVVGPAPPEGGGGHGRDPGAEGVGEVHGGAEGGAGITAGRPAP